MKRSIVKTTSGEFLNSRYNPNTFNALDAAILFIVFLAVEFAVGRVFTHFARAYIAAHETYDYYLLMIIGTLIPQSLLFVLAFFYGKIRKVDYLSGGGFVFKFDALNFTFAAMLTLGIMLAVSPVHLQFADDVYFIFYGQTYGEYAAALSEKVSGNLVLVFLYTYIIVPLLPAIVEEGFYRGVMLRGLGQFGKGFAVIVSSLCFALMHGSVEQMLLQFILGLAIGSVVMLTGNFFLGCFMHFMNNLASVIIEVNVNIADNLMEGLGSVLEASSLIVGVAILTVSAVYFINLLLSEQKRVLGGKLPKKTAVDGGKVYALILSGDSRTEEEKTYLKTDYRELDGKIDVLGGGEYFCRGKVWHFNKRSGEKLSKILIFVAVGASALLVVLNVFI